MKLVRAYTTSDTPTRYCYFFEPFYYKDEYQNYLLAVLKYDKENPLIVYRRSPARIIKQWVSLPKTHLVPIKIV